jgi:putative magnesium chelatase accessory protein
MNWEQDAAGWPHREASRFVTAAGLRWHIQVLGQGPVALLVHGTGATTHSWRDLAPRLAEHFTIVAADLPGHGFSASAPARCMSLTGMAEGLAALLQVLGMQPALVVGHSAGAAVLSRMALDRSIQPGAIVSLNGAFAPLSGVQRLMSPVARLLALSSVVPRLVAARAQRSEAAQRLIASTGSTLDADGSALYARLLRDPAHLSGALAMMANWRLDALWAELPALRPAPLLLVGSNDHTVPPDQAWTVAERIRGAHVHALPGLGHLAHEEASEQVAAIIVRYARERDPPSPA